ncbi:MAG TPA: prepilin-type N-terminal cleavage/methylation domain-containing protein [Longimicrobium sp.]|nr:prepilin-type N-terminal cleavage/methylation domain-containing protein [Longimicrobium sp.]
MSSSRNPAGARAGFTLIELMIGMILAGLFATVLFQLILGQSRFTREQGGREEVQQNVRGAMELIASELRAVPAGAITAAGSNSIAFRMPRAYGVLCDAPTLTAGTAWVAFPAEVFPADLPASYTSTNWGIALPGLAGNGTLAGFPMTGVATVGNACAGLNLPVGTTALVRGIRYSGLATTGATGTPVFLYQEFRYRVDTSPDPALEGKWLLRANGASAAQPLAGPMIETGTAAAIGGISFRYLCGTTLVAPSLVTAANINGIRVVLAMQSRTTNGARRQDEVDSTTVHLRNSETTTCT